MNGEAKTVHDSLAVANYFIAKAAKEGRGLDSLQIMKLTYIAHGFTLGLLDKPLLEDDVLAWKFGPVIRRIYDHLPGGYRKIDRPLADVSGEFSENERSILDQVFEKYGQLHGTRLSSLTHQSGTPWKVTWDRVGQNAVIPQDAIHEYYKGLVGRG